MASHVEKLIKASAWASLPTPTEKLISVWFAATYPNQPLDVLFKDVPQKEIISGIGSHQRYVKSALGTMAQNTFFIKVYENLCLKRNQVSDKKRTPITHVSDTCQTPVTHVSDPQKESERERESSPRTPFIEREKGKENTHNTPNPPQGGKRVDADGDAWALNDEQKVRIRQSHVTQGEAMPNRQSEQAANSTKDQSVNVQVGLKDETAFQTFLEVYPKKVYLKGTAGAVLRGEWHGCEAEGWTGALILEALRCAILSEEWQKENGRFIPIAKRFLEQRMMERFLPPETVCEVLKCSEGAKQFRVVPLKFPKQFEEFCQIYPKRKGLVGAELVAVRQAWHDCEVNGWDGHDILRATRSALTSKYWTEDDGRYIPIAVKFLKEEKMRQFLPIGFNPRGGSFVGTKKPITEEEAYWSNLENFA
jgi:hypothetical protein